MRSMRIKQWLGRRIVSVALSLFIISLLLYAVAYLLEKGFTALSPATVVSAIATAILLAAVSVTIEQYTKANLTDGDIASLLKFLDLGITHIQERDVEQGFFSGLPKGILEDCRKEFVIVAYAADNFIERNRRWISNMLARGLKIAIVILNPTNLAQAKETEGRDIEPQIKKALNYCKEFVERETPGIENLTVKAYSGHLYYTGVFLDRDILQSKNARLRRGLVCIQLKANFKSQHEGIVLAFSPDSKYAAYYSDSCRKIWAASDTLIGQ